MQIKWFINIHTIETRFNYNIIERKDYEAKQSWKKSMFLNQWKYLTMFLQKNKKNYVFWFSSKTLLIKVLKG